MNATSARCPGPISRRSFLQVGTLGPAGFGLSSLLHLQAEAKEASPPENDPAVIFIWMPGGPPHMEMYDMKPDAPAEYRGEFRPIKTNVPGIDVCELMPMHAKCADRYNIIRSVAHTFFDHGGGSKRFLTGRIPAEPTGFVNDAPPVGSIVAKCLEQRNVGLPNYISGSRGANSSGAAYLGPSYTPFTVTGDPSGPKFTVKNISMTKAVSDRLEDRTTLLRGFDNLRRSIDQSGTMDAMDKFDRQAIDLLTSDRARAAFDLSLETDAVKDRYGRHAWGARALMARRLVEAGCSFVTMVMENPFQSGIRWLKNGTGNWDSHAVNCHLFDDARVRLPIYDRAITALVEDLYDRGLDRRVLLVATGEFGRSPKLRQQVGSRTSVMQPGREHWPRAMSMLVAGGGMRTGQVIGQTNAKGEEPRERPLTPNDLWATVYRHLGIDYTRSFPDNFGRPMPILPFGKPIEELL